MSDFGIPGAESAEDLSTEAEEVQALLLQESVDVRQREQAILRTCDLLDTLRERVIAVPGGDWNERREELRSHLGQPLVNMFRECWTAWFVGHEYQGGLDSPSAPRDQNPLYQHLLEQVNLLNHLESLGMTIFNKTGLKKLFF